jgi:hypothetical protein
LSQPCCTTDLTLFAEFLESLSNSPKLFLMATLTDVQTEADGLTLEEKAGLIARLLDSFPNVSAGPDDEEVAKRVAEMDSGEVVPLTHEQFLSEMGRG